MATRIDEAGEGVSFTFEGHRIEARSGDTVASALAAAGQRHLRDSVVSGEPRGHFCMMGTCFDCLLVIDGKPNVQACRTNVRNGMKVRRQKGLESGE